MLNEISTLSDWLFTIFYNNIRYIKYLMSEIYNIHTQIVPPAVVDGHRGRRKWIRDAVCWSIAKIDDGAQLVKTRYVQARYTVCTGFSNKWYRWSAGSYATKPRPIRDETDEQKSGRSGASDETEVENRRIGRRNKLTKRGRWLSRRNEQVERSANRTDETKSATDRIEIGGRGDGNVGGQLCTNGPNAHRRRIIIRINWFILKRLVKSRALQKQLTMLPFHWSRKRNWAQIAHNWSENNWLGDLQKQIWSTNLKRKSANWNTNWIERNSRSRKKKLNCEV
jgi:hypothetical protein